jgi:L-seryl-tRNA(Ser) seleniumtransferase
MTGFVKSPTIKQLASKIPEGTLLVSDLGSGNMVNRLDSGPVLEPQPKQMLSNGADLVCFSGDKMLGGVQAGIIAGNSNFIKRIKNNPLMRAFRVGKLTYAALQYVLTNHLTGNHNKVTLHQLAGTPVEKLNESAEQFIKTNNLSNLIFTVVPSFSTFGGGATPEEEIPSCAVKITCSLEPDAIAGYFQQLEPPLVGIVKDDSFLIDFRTILETDRPILANALKSFENYLNKKIQH